MVEPSHVGAINYVPITQQSPANRYWGIDETISYGKGNVILQSAGIIDTGSTLIMLATDAFQAYRDAIGATLDVYVLLFKSEEHPIYEQIQGPRECSL